MIMSFTYTLAPSSVQANVAILSGIVLQSVLLKYAAARLYKMPLCLTPGVSTTTGQISLHLWSALCITVRLRFTTCPGLHLTVRFKAVGPSVQPSLGKACNIVLLCSAACIA